MSRAPDAAVEDWIDQARSVSVQEAAARLGAKLKKAGPSEWVGPCPACAGTDRFSINTAKGVFNCRGASEGGDSISMTQHVMGMDFMAACEWLNQSPPPGRGTVIDHEEVERRRRETQAKVAEQERQRAQEAARKRSKDEERALRIWEAAMPINGTHALAYLHARACFPTPTQTVDLRFMPKLRYWGPNGEDMGFFPCMIQAVRNADLSFKTIHRTFLDTDKPAKLNLGKDCSARKFVGSIVGGGIYLGQVEEVMAIGEGVETTLSYYTCGLPRLNDDRRVGLVAAATLDNIAGIDLPPMVKEVIILGDADTKDKEKLKRVMKKACRRFMDAGIRGAIHWSPAGKDWNDLAQEERAALTGAMGRVEEALG